MNDQTGVAAVATLKGGINQQIIDAVRDRLGPDVYEKYLADTALFRQSDEGVEVLAATAFTAEWIDRRFGAAIREAAGAGDRDRVRFVPAPEAFGRRSAEPREAHRPGSLPPERAARQSDAPLRSTRNPRRGTAATDLRHRLDDFCVGESNRLAHAAACRLLDDDAGRSISPLFIHGSCGLGKTHLLQGIAARALQTKPGARVLCTTAEAFTNAFISAIKDNGVDAFRRRYRGLDLLCIDDVHFLSSKSATQQEFLYTFDTLGLEGARIALASDAHPGDVQALSKELRSRFLAGLVVQVAPPEVELRVRLVEQLAARRGLSVQSDAVAVVAQRPVESVREIEGLLATLHAHQRLTGAASIDGGMARAALQAERAARPRKPPRLEVIVQRVTEAMHLDLSEVMGTSRHKRVVLARGIAAALARRLTTCSFPEIARSLGRPSHSGVIAATQRIEKMIEGGDRCDAGPTIRDISVRDLLDRLTAELQSRPAR